MSYYLIAVYWPGQGYGGADRLNSIKDADAAIARHVKLGYGSKRCPIHIIKRTDDEVVRVEDSQPDKMEKL